MQKEKHYVFLNYTNSHTSGYNNWSVVFYGWNLFRIIIENFTRFNSQCSKNL